MCGRFYFAQDKEDIIKWFGIAKLPWRFPRSYNIAPRQIVPAILNETPTELSLLKWGLIPFWAKDEKIAFKMINARCETVAEKPAYKNPFKNRRCLVLADGFFEWTKSGKKTPYVFYMKDKRTFAFAGIWETWKHEGELIRSCSIITCPPNSLMEPIHNRMPAILPQEAHQEWLGKISIKKALNLLKPYDAEKMKCLEIDPLVNSPDNNAPEVLRPVKREVQQTLL